MERPEMNLMSKFAYNQQNEKMEYLVFVCFLWTGL